MTTIKANSDTMIDLPAPPAAIPAWQKCLLVCFGWTMVAIGVVGIFLPVLPTTVFMIVALWAFSRSSRKFQLWLWTHPTFGPPVRNWHKHGIIPARAKVLAVTVMSLSFLYVAIWVAEDWRLPAIIAAVMLPAAIYIVTRPSKAKDATD